MLAFRDAPHCAMVERNSGKIEVIVAGGSLPGSELSTDDEAYPPLPLGACVKKNKPCTGDGTLACGAIFATLVYGP